MATRDRIPNADFLGGPPRAFDRAGREQLIVLLEHGLVPSSTVLDIGCGVLRGGRWMIPLLEPGHYFGIEPQQHMVERGLREFVDPEIVALKQPRFDHNDRFDFGVFDTKFSHFIARSIWTHASKAQIEQMLDGVAEWGTPDAVMLASFNRPIPFVRRDYRGKAWVGRSHESEEGSMVAHRPSWIRKASASRGLVASNVRRKPLSRGGQIWMAIRRTAR